MLAGGQNIGLRHAGNARGCFLILTVMKFPSEDTWKVM